MDDTGAGTARLLALSWLEPPRGSNSNHPVLRVAGRPQRPAQPAAGQPQAFLFPQAESAAGARVGEQPWTRAAGRCYRAPGRRNREEAKPVVTPWRRTWTLLGGEHWGSPVSR